MLPREGLRSLAEQGGERLSDVLQVVRLIVSGFSATFSGRLCGHILASSVLQYRHFRVPAFDRRGTFVESLAAALRKIQYGATVDRVTADCMMMFESWRAS